MKMVVFICFDIRRNILVILTLNFDTLFAYFYPSNALCAYAGIQARALRT
jgi:hypothetical protein